MFLIYQIKFVYLYEIQILNTDMIDARIEVIITIQINMIFPPSLYRR